MNRRRPRRRAFRRLTDSDEPTHIAHVSYARAGVSAKLHKCEVLGERLGVRRSVRGSALLRDRVDRTEDLIGGDAKDRSADGEVSS